MTGHLFEQLADNWVGATAPAEQVKTIFTSGLAVLAYVRRQHWLRSLDRHFFREHYNAQEILRATLKRVSIASSLAEVAPIVVKEIESAMHPLFCAIVEHDHRKKTYELVSIYPEGASPPALRFDSKAVELAKVMAKPVQLTSDDSWLARQLPSSETQTLERSGVDLIAPVKGPGSDALIVWAGSDLRSLTR